MDPWKRRFLLETIISRFHVNFWGCIWEVRTCLQCCRMASFHLTMKKTPSFDALQIFNFRRTARIVMYTPQNKHGTWKWTLGKGDSYWKPSFPGSMLIFGGVSNSSFRFLAGQHDLVAPTVIMILHPQSLTVRPWKRKDGWKAILSFSEGNFSGAYC